MKHLRRPVRIAIIAAAVWFFQITPARAQHADAGTTLFDFVNVQYDARSVGLSGATVALPNECYGMFSNPAALCYVAGRQAAIGYRPLGSGIFGIPLAFALPVQGAGVFGISGYGLTSGSISPIGIGPDGSPVTLSGSARADNVAGSISWANVVNEYFGAGVTVRGLYSSIKNIDESWSADGIALDAGLQCRLLNSRLIFGLVLRNMGLVLSGFEKDDAYPFPFEVATGVSFVPRSLEDIRLIFDMSKKQRADYLMIKPALEVNLIREQLLMRLGYSLSSRDLKAFYNTLKGTPEDDYYKSNSTGFCVGMGLYSEAIGKKVQLDVAAEFTTLTIMPLLVVSMIINL